MVERVGLVEAAALAVPDLLGEFEHDGRTGGRFTREIDLFVARAVLEGVTLALRENLAALAKAGTSLRRITAVGGGSRSAYWLGLIAAALRIEVDVPAAGEHGAALGAARLGALAAGRPASEICAPPGIARTVAPDPDLADALRARSDRFAALRAAQQDRHRS